MITSYRVVGFVKSPYTSDVLRASSKGPSELAVEIAMRLCPSPSLKYMALCRSDTRRKCDNPNSRGLAIGIAMHRELILVLEVFRRLELGRSGRLTRILELL